MKDFLSVIRTRRSYYGIQNTSPISEERIIELVQEATRHTPSSFHMQGARVVVLFGREHKRLWKLTEDALRKVVPAGKFSSTEKKLASFAAGYGTVLYFDDTAVTDSFGEKFSMYRENFPIWAQQGNGMLQFAVWNLLEAEGLGASLQHYNPLIDEAVRDAWNLPASWKLIAQMPFGEPTAQPGEKTFVPIEERVKVFGQAE